MKIIKKQPRHTTGFPDEENKTHNRMVICCHAHILLPG